MPVGAREIVWAVLIVGGGVWLWQTLVVSAEERTRAAYAKMEPKPGGGAPDSEALPLVSGDDPL